jgi:F-box protein 9
MEESSPDLESFRQQWKAEVSARSKASSSRVHAKEAAAQKSPRKPSGSLRLAPQNLLKGEEHREEDGISRTKESFGDIEEAEVASKGKSREPRSALEHYERAVEREAQGNLGDSLNLYRKAFRVC